MAAPLLNPAQTPWTPHTWGRLRELCLRSIGVSDKAHASPDVLLPDASAQEIAVMGGLLQEGLVELQEIRGDYFPLSVDSVTAVVSGVTAGTYPSVLLPADFGEAVKGGFHVAGWPVDVMTEEQYQRNRVPDSLGGGVALTMKTGMPPSTPYALRLTPSKQEADTTAFLWVAWLYPLQTAAWTLEVAYKATARAMTGDTSVVRLPNRLLRPLRLYARAGWAEANGNPKEAAERWALYRDALNEVESVLPSPEQQHEMILTAPLDGGL